MKMLVCKTIFYDSKINQNKIIRNKINGNIMIFKAPIFGSTHAKLRSYIDIP